jgi:hypothetical protein
MLPIEEGCYLRKKGRDLKLDEINNYMKYTCRKNVQAHTYCIAFWERGTFYFQKV